MASILAPTKGLVLIPAHLRVNFVPQAPLLLRHSLFENLTFGLNAEQVERCRSSGRCQKVLRRLRLGEEIIKLVEVESVCSWHEVLSESQKQRLCLARALIYNPEVLIVDRPFLMTKAEDREAMGMVIRDFVDRRGLEIVEKDSQSVMHRRARTCVYTTERKFLKNVYADEVLEIKSGHVIEVHRNRQLPHQLSEVTGVAGKESEQELQKREREADLLRSVPVMSSHLSL
jgi:ABC-type multidrug transport system fused ATPase/permease subunit